MTNTINNVPRELLENIVLCYNEGEFELGTLAAECHALLSAPSPAGVYGLEVVGYLFQHEETGNVMSVDAQQVDWGFEANNPRLHRVCALADYDKAQAIIDGLRGEFAAQEETANQWRELALQFDRHRMTAMAHIRAAASGDKSAIEALGVFAALPPIPGHEITAAFDKQAQRIGELEGLLQKSYQQVNSECMDWAKEYERRKEVQAERDTLKSMLREFAVGISKREMPTEQELNSWFDRIDAALAAGKDAAP